MWQRPYMALPSAAILYPNIVFSPSFISPSTYTDRSKIRSIDRQTDRQTNRQTEAREVGGVRQGREEREAGEWTDTRADLHPLKREAHTPKPMREKSSLYTCMKAKGVHV